MIIELNFSRIRIETTYRDRDMGEEDGLRLDSADNTGLPVAITVQ